MSEITGLDLVAIPSVYLPEFLRDPADALLKYGSLPQRARNPWFMDLDRLKAALCLENLVRGPQAVALHDPLRPEVEWYAGVAHPTEEMRLVGAISPDYLLARSDWQSAPWHVHIDPGLGRGRKGDAAGLALGRIVDQAHVTIGAEVRRVNRYVVPLVMQIVAPEGGEIYLTALSRFVLQLRGVLGINVTSFSYDGFQSAGALQELTLAGLVTAGVRFDPQTGRLEGFGKPFSVDRTPAPHQELKEAVNEGRVLLPDYWPLARELSRLEDIPGHAPDHPVAIGASKDVADAVAGVVGYLAEHGHAVFVDPYESVVATQQDSVGIGVRDEAPARLSIE